MARYKKPTVLDLDSQRLLAAWAVKTVYLLELAARQQYPGTRLVEGYEPSSHHPALIDAGFSDLQTPIPWWDGRILRYRFPPR